jgi:catechol 2,3-dioxygenase-like lactoylglutathione lyase family enzyme
MEDFMGDKMIHGAADLAHIGIPCNNYGKSVAFYESIGFKPDVVLAESKGFYRAGDCVLELYQFKGTEKPVEAGPVNHFALRSEDIEASFAEAQALGFTILSKGIESNQMYAPKSNRYFIIEGPDGERVEFAQQK